MTRKIITIEEFIKEVISGERDFSNTRFLRGNTDFRKNCSYKDLLHYLHNANLKEAPIILNGVYWTHVKAPGIYLPYVSARNANFSRCHFDGGNFDFGDFTQATFKKTDLSSFSLEGAKLDGLKIRISYHKQGPSIAQFQDYSERINNHEEEKKRKKRINASVKERGQLQRKLFERLKEGGQNA